jgi:hypothetical protein
MLSEQEQDVLMRDVLTLIDEESRFFCISWLLLRRCIGDSLFSMYPEDIRWSRCHLLSYGGLSNTNGSIILGTAKAST